MNLKKIHALLNHKVEVFSKVDHNWICWIEYSHQNHSMIYYDNLYIYYFCGNSIIIIINEFYHLLIMEQFIRIKKIGKGHYGDVLLV